MRGKSHDAGAPAVAVVPIGECDFMPGRRVHHRLSAGGREVENRETAMREQRAPAGRVGRRGQQSASFRCKMIDEAKKL